MDSAGATAAAEKAAETAAAPAAASRGAATPRPSDAGPDGGDATSVAPPRGLRASRWATTTIFLVNGSAIGIWAAHIPLIKESHQLSEARLSVVLLGFALGAIATMIMSGWLSARFGSGRVTVLAGLAFCAALPLPSIAPVLPALFAAAILLGGCNGAMDVAMNAHASTLERAWRAPIMSSFHAFFSLGGLAGAAISSALIVRGFGAQTNMPLAALFLVPVVLIASRRLWKDDAWASPDARLSDGTREDGAAARPNIPKIALPSKGLVRLGAIVFCAAIAEGAMVDWTGVYLSTVLGAAAAFAAAGFAACSLSMTIGRLTGDRIIARFGRRETMTTSGIVAAVGLAVGVLGQTPLVAALGFGLAGFGLANIVPIVFADAGHANPSAPGIGVATVATMGYAGFLLGPPAIGFTAGLVGLRLAMVLLVIAAILITLLGPSAIGPTTSRSAADRR